MPDRLGDQIKEHLYDQLAKEGAAEPTPEQEAQIDEIAFEFDEWCESRPRPDGINYDFDLGTTAK